MNLSQSDGGQMIQDPSSSRNSARRPPFNRKSAVKSSRSALGRFQKNLCSFLLPPYLHRSSINAPINLSSEQQEPTTDWVYTIKARLCEKKLHEEILRAGLDSLCKHENLLSLDSWHRLNQYENRTLQPCSKVVCPLKSKSQDKVQIPVIGIAKDVKWYFLKGSLTYVSDFLVIDMKEYDVVIGQKTIKAYKLLRPGDDVPPF